MSDAGHAPSETEARFASFVDAWAIAGALSIRTLPDDEEERLDALLRRLFTVLSACDESTRAELDPLLRRTVDAAQRSSGQAAQVASALHRFVTILRFTPRPLARMRRKILPSRLRRLSPEMWRQIRVAYIDRYSEEPRAALERLGRIPSAQVVVELLEGRAVPSRPPGQGAPDSATLEELRSALDRHRASTVWRLFAGRTADERKALRQAFDTAFAPSALSSEIATSFNRLEGELLHDVIDTGVVPKGKLLFYAVAGIGTDERSIRLILQQTKRTEIREVIKSFHETWERYAPRYERLLPHWFGDLRHRLLLECGGDCWFDLSRYLESPPRSIRERSARLRAWLEYEDSGPLMSLLTARSVDGSILRDQAATLHRLLAHAPSDVDTPPSPSHLRARGVAVALEQELEISRDSKHLLGNLLAVAVTAPLATTTIVTLTALHATLLHLILAVAILSAASRVLVKSLVKGRGYHHEEIAVDVCCSCLDGATLFTSRFLRDMFIRGGTGFVTKLAFRSGLSRALQPAVLAELLDLSTPQYDRRPEGSSWVEQPTANLLRRLEELLDGLSAHP